jgi:hypothetical protein
VVFDPGRTSLGQLRSWVTDCGYHCAGQSVPAHVRDPMAEPPSDKQSPAVTAETGVPVQDGHMAHASPPDGDGHAGHQPGAASAEGTRSPGGDGPRRARRDVDGGHGPRHAEPFPGELNLALALLPDPEVLLLDEPYAGFDSGATVQVVTAGWAAAFIAAIGAYFQVRGARAADRRLVLAGLPARQLATARAVTGLALAAIASAAALATLALRVGISDCGPVIAGTFMFAVIYLAIGAVIGALVASPVNGTVLILFAWLVDVMFGPVFGSSARPAGRVFPTHFLTMWMTNMPSHHAGQLGTWMGAGLDGRRRNPGLCGADLSLTHCPAAARQPHLLPWPACSSSWTPAPRTGAWSWPANALALS